MVRTENLIFALNKAYTYMTVPSINITLFWSISLCFLVSFTVCAQDFPPLQVDGQVLDGRDRLEDAYVRIEKDGNFDREVRTGRRGKFEIELDLFHEYTIYFGKEGYVVKKIYVDTRTIPEGQVKNSYLRYGGWKVEIFPDDLGVDIAILDKPIGKVTYSDEYKSFINDDFYTKTIQRQLDKLVDDLRRARDEQIMAQERLDEEYQLAIEDAEAFEKEEDYENALFQYRAAMKLKPNEKLPQKQIEKLNEKINASRDLEERYNSLLTQADDYFYEKNWKEALNLYKDASTIKPNEFYPKDQIDKCEEEIESAMKRERLQTEYDKQLAKADQAFEGGAVKESKELYKSALNILPEEEYPQQQIDLINQKLAEEGERQKMFDEKMEQGIAAMEDESFDQARKLFTDAMKIDPKDRAPKEKIAEIEMILSDRAEERERQKEEEKKRRAQYEKLIAEADELLGNEDWNEASERYKKALKMYNEQYPAQQLDKINALKKQQKEAEKQYANCLAEGNKLLTGKNYEQARVKYAEALELKPDAEEPINRIEEIDRILRRLAQQKKRDEWAKEQELKRKNAEYDSLIVLADGALGSEQYNEAKNLYTKALNIFDDKDYPAKKLEEIKQTEKRIELNEQEYARSIKAADEAFKAEDWEQAAMEYQTASSLKPDEEYPKQQILKLNEIVAKEKEAKAEKLRAQKEEAEKAQAEYDEKINTADKLFADSQYVKAIDVYTEALSIMPEEKYPKQQIEQANDMIKKIEDMQKERQRLAALATENEEKYNELLAEANNSVRSNAYEEALVQLNEAIELIPTRDKAKVEKAKVEELIAERNRKEEERLKAEAEMEEKQRKYNAAMQLAANNLTKEKYEEAIKHYETAAGILPEEKEPERKIEEIEELLAQLEKEEQERLEKERLRKEIEENYQKAIAEADSFMANENYRRARSAYERASGLMPQEDYPQDQIKKIYNLQEAERERLASFNSDLSRFNYELAEKYPEGKTENVEEKGNRTVTTIVIVRGEVGHEFVKEEYSWGDVYYRKNRRPYVKQNWEREVNEF